MVLALMMFISAWLTGGGVSDTFSRIGLAATASACLLLVVRRWWREAVVLRLKPLVRILSAHAIGNNDVEAATPGNDEISRLESLVQRVCPGQQEANSEAAASICRGLSGNLRLAADHLESIKTLLEVSQSHQQPIPRAAFQNLELVSKNLREIERQFPAGSQDRQLDRALQFR